MVDLGQPGHSGAPALSHVEEVPLLNFEHCDFSNLFSCFLANTVIFLSGAPALSHVEEVPLLNFEYCDFSNLFSCFLFIFLSGVPALSHVEEVSLFSLPVFSPHFKNVFCISWCRLFLKVHQFSFFVDSEAVVFSYLFHASLLLFSCFLQTLLYFFLSMILFSLS